jgi:hypothetical protein
MTSPDHAGLAPHAADYHEGAWLAYTPAELGWWVHLLLKRSAMRADPAKRHKDLHDARNYLEMLAAHVDAARAVPEGPP